MQLFRHVLPHGLLELLDGNAAEHRRERPEHYGVGNRELQIGLCQPAAGQRNHAGIVRGLTGVQQDSAARLQLRKGVFRKQRIVQKDAVIRPGHLAPVADRPVVQPRNSPSGMAISAASR